MKLMHIFSAMKYKWSLVTRDTLEDIITYPGEFDSILEALSNYDTFRNTPYAPIFEDQFDPCHETDWTVQFWFKVNEKCDLNIWGKTDPQAKDY